MSETRTEVVEEIVESGSNSSNGCKYPSIAIVVIAFLCVGFLGITLLFGQAYLSQIFGGLSDLFQTSPSSAQVVTQRTLVNSIQPLGQLVTIRTEIAKADILVQVDTGGLNLCGHSAQHVAQGVIEAGIDFTAITTDSINYSKATDTYTITMPYPQVTSCRIEYIRQYDTKSNLGCSPNWDNVRLLAQYVATNEFVEDALDAGLLERAQRESTLLMQSFVNALTSANVEILYNITEDSTPFIPYSCQPEIPQGWTFDDELQKWVSSS